MVMESQTWKKSGNTAITFPGFYLTCILIDSIGHKPPNKEGT